MEDYEQLYYDSLYTIKKLKQQNETLENDLQLVNKNKIKDGILKFYIENGYIYCENTKSQERVVVSTIDKKGGIV